MNLDLDPVQITDLKEALHAFTKGLLGELAHADQRQYREMLREKVGRYEALLSRLDPPAPRSRPAV